jgi:DNA-binding response OmpR family regulator
LVTAFTGRSSYNAEVPATVLIADDSESIRSLLEMILSAEGHTVIQVEDGRAALSYLKDNTPDLMILDVTMPFIDGIDICGRVKRISRLKASPVIILTAHTDDESRKRALAAGADAFVNKPLAGKNLRQTIGEMLDRREEMRMKQTQITIEEG